MVRTALLQSWFRLPRGAAQAQLSAHQLLPYPKVPVSCAQCNGIIQEFDHRLARKELRRYRRRGPSGTTRRLLNAIRDLGPEGLSFLDVGGGIGAIQHGLMAAGASDGTHVDAAPAYLAAARSEAERLGHADRMHYIEGDFVAVASLVESADIVTLDRVVCCYDDMPALIDASAARARRLYGLVFPREHFPIRLAFIAINFIQRLRERPFNVFLHGTAAVDARIRSHGFRRIFLARSPLWQIHLYLKTDEASPSPA